MKISVALPSDKIKSDVMALGVFQGQEKSLAKCVEGEALRKVLNGWASAGHFSGGCGKQFFSFIPADSTRGVIVAGLGEKKKFSAQTIRRLGAALLARANELKFKHLRIDLETLLGGSVKYREATMALIEGARLKEYRFDKYKSKSKESENAGEMSLKEISLVVKGKGDLNDAQTELEIGEEVLAATNFVRLLGDEPGNIMTPSRLADEARKMAKDAGIKCRILDEKEIRAKKMGGILSVAQGSKEPPRFIILEYKGGAGKPVVLVGKGITFDSGGISLKPAARMDLMRYDMCGGAAVVGALRAAANLKLKHNIIGLVPTCENLPSETPQRPGDIHTTYSGKTVEVLNTDAEGRLILSDALAYAQEFKPRAIIDLATLTGACVATFGDLAIGMMGNNDKLLAAVKDAGEKTGERCWPLPLWDEYGEMVKGVAADLKNIGSGYAGTITAGKFLEAFVGDFPWVHLDIAGVAWRESPAYYAKHGATGAGVRLLIRFLRDLKK